MIKILSRILTMLIIAEFLLSAFANLSYAVENENLLIAEKIGEFTEYGIYYRQEYKVSSTAEFSEYTISNTSGIPDGGFIADINGNEKNTFSKDENFYIMIPQKQIKENINVDVTINAECKVNMVLNGQNILFNTNAKLTINFKQNVNTCKISISKLDGSNKKGIKGVEFRLLNEQGEVIDTQVSGELGYFEFNNLYPGKYTIVEVEPKEGYIPLEKGREIEIEYGKKYGIGITNERKRRKSKNIQN